MTTQLDDLLAGGGTSFKFEQPGDTVTGVITNVQVRQVRDFDTGKPAFWDDGKPQEQIVITLATDEHDPSRPDDDGERNVYIKGWGGQLRAFRTAVKQAGGKPGPGDRFQATFTQYGPKPDRGFPPKEYAYVITKATALDGLVGDVASQAPQPAYVPPAPTAPPAQQAPASATPAEQSPAEKARQMRELGVPDEQIATTLGIDPSIIPLILGA